jgi:ferredoxin
VKVIVDRSLCQDYGQCVISAPQVFRLDDDGVLIFEEHPGDSDRADVEAAADACPFQAISIADD